MTPRTLHMLPNAHIDPVWQWDWREGLTIALRTCRTVLDLMDEYDDLTFLRGEALNYEYIERTDPKTFARIRRQIDAGRWDIVGGNYIQTDQNMPATETMIRQFLRGQQYFQRAFGRTVRTAWATDNFGHAAGIPNILAAAGFDNIALTRPYAWQHPLPSAVFWWEGTDGSRILTYRPPIGWYGCERDEIPRRLSEYLAWSKNTPLENIGVFYGLGDHGGGPTRRLIEDIKSWAAAHPEVRVVHSTLSGYFAALRGEARRRGPNAFPVVPRELNFTQRGCYVSMARLKFPFRRLEALAGRAERTDAAVSALLRRKPADMQTVWDGLLYNTFHDILTGTCLERAMEDQIAWLGGGLHRTQQVEMQALQTLSDQMDTTVPKPAADSPAALPHVVFNPHPWPYRGLVEIQAGLDDRPIHAYQDRPEKGPVEVRGPDGHVVSFQRVRTETNFMPNLFWQVRVAFQAEVPPMGWSVFTVGYLEGAKNPALSSRVCAPRPGTIENETLRVQARRGARGVNIQYRGRSLFGASGLSVITLDDPWGSWGGIDNEPASDQLDKVLHTWTIEDVRTLESGPELARLWVLLRGGRSSLELAFSLSRDRAVVDVSGRLLLDERSARVSLRLPTSARTAEYEVPGGGVRRGFKGDVPGGRWARVGGARGFGFVSDALYGFCLRQGEFRAHIARATRYAADGPAKADERPWEAAMDRGELRFQFLLTPGNADLPRLSAELERPPAVQLATDHPGKLPRRSSLASLAPEGLELLALKPAENGRGWILRIQNRTGRAVPRAVWTWLGQRLVLGRIPDGRIATWRLTESAKRWRATPIAANEIRR